MKTVTAPELSGCSKYREHQKADASKATADYYAAQQKIRNRTQELRRLRLEREAQKDVQY